MKRKKGLIEECNEALNTFGTTDRPVRHWLLRCLGILGYLVIACGIAVYFAFPLVLWAKGSTPVLQWIGGIWSVLNGVGFFAFITQDGFSDGG